MRGRFQADYLQFLDEGGLRGARIGVMRKGFSGYSPETDAIIEEAIAALKELGATIIDPADLPSLDQLKNRDIEGTVLHYEFKADLNAYLASLGPNAPVKTMEDVIRFNEEHADRELKYFGQEHLIESQSKGPLTEQEYLDALAANRRMSREEGIDAVMEQYHLDALVAATGAPAWLIDLVNGDHHLGASSSPPARAGYPIVTVPAGFAFGLPVGLSFIGRAFSEPTLIRLAYAFEHGTKVRRAPRFLPTLPL